LANWLGPHKSFKRCINYFHAQRLAPKNIFLRTSYLCLPLDLFFVCLATRRMPNTGFFAPRFRPILLFRIHAALSNIYFIASRFKWIYLGLTTSDLRMGNLLPFGSSIIWVKWIAADGLDQIQAIFFVNFWGEQTFPPKITRKEYIFIPENKNHFRSI